VLVECRNRKLDVRGSWCPPKSPSPRGVVSGEHLVRAAESLRELAESRKNL